MGYIKVTNIGKAYKIYSTRWSRLWEWAAPFSKPCHQLNWILKNINFTVKSGESVGVVGINGAGKSTLLKLIARTTLPTTGKIVIGGRIAALLELGMGFHPDFTGRQNVAMAAQLMGLESKDIINLMPKIETFAEIGDYIDQPVRVYSSGMQMRLAFSVATAIRPDVLIVDEALSVGDTYFQHKSFERIRQFRKQGTTLLIVSHDKNSIQSLCDRAILLDQGKVTKEGPPEEVMDFYNAMIAEKENNTINQVVLKNGKVQTKSGTGEVRVEEICLIDSCGKKAECVRVGEQVELQIRVKVIDDIKSLVLGYGIKDRLGQVMYGTNTWYTNDVICKPIAGDIYKFVIKFPANFGIGSYSVVIALHDRDNHLNSNYCWLDMALLFNVVNVGKIQFNGCNWIEPKIKVNQI